jgi:hypothetical protein
LLRRLDVDELAHDRQVLLARVLHDSGRPPAGPGLGGDRVVKVS